MSGHDGSKVFGAKTPTVTFCFIAWRVHGGEKSLKHLLQNPEESNLHVRWSRWEESKNKCYIQPDLWLNSRLCTFCSGHRQIEDGITVRGPLFKKKKKRSMNNVLQMSGWPSLHYRVAAENMWTSETTRQTETQTEKRVFVLVSTCWLITESWASDDHRLWLPDTQINPEGPLSTHQRRRGGFHSACLNWVCALIINTSQTLSLSLCCCW